MDDTVEKLLEIVSDENGDKEGRVREVLREYGLAVMHDSAYQRELMDEE